MKYESNVLLTLISIIQRNTNRYFGTLLEKHRIGSGQQFFLLCAYENDGITMYDLAKMGNYDKGTVTKAVQKLSDEGYVIVSVDEQDKRIRHLHITEKAYPLIHSLYRMRDEWVSGLLSQLPEEPRQMFLNAVKNMADLSCKNLDIFLNCPPSFEPESNHANVGSGCPGSIQ